LTLEAAPGKNPVTHVGKLYQIASRRIAESLVAEVRGVAAAECYLVSQIGRPVADPHRRYQAARPWKAQAGGPRARG
jgi:S-adenosylmethionine synthetase